MPPSSKFKTTESNFATTRATVDSAEQDYSRTGKTVSLFHSYTLINARQGVLQWRTSTEVSVGKLRGTLSALH